MRVRARRSIGSVSLVSIGLTRLSDLFFRTSRVFRQTFYSFCFLPLSATRLSVRLLRISPRIPRCFVSKAFRRSVQPALPFLLPTVFIPAFRFSVFLESLAFLRRFSSAFGFSPAVLECRLLPAPHCLFEWSSQDFCLFSPVMSVLYTGRFCLSIGFLKIFEIFSTNLPSPVFPRDSRSFFAFFGQK